jgi:hypothetical protein
LRRRTGWFTAFWSARLVGLAGSLLYRALEFTEHTLLQRLAGYETARAAGEELTDPAERAPFRPWLLAFLPAIGALLASGQRELVVLDEDGLIAGFLDEAQIHAAYHRVTSKARDVDRNHGDAGHDPSNRSR